MSVSKYIVWADNALEIDRVPPSADKQLAGWTEELPPHQWFNWYMNRTDKRLAALEDPFEINTLISHPGERAETILAGEDYQLPQSYVVGSNKLRVFLEGLLTYCGPEHTYVEVGQPGELSNIIRFNDDIPTDYAIRVEIPIKARDNIAILDDNGMLSQESIDAKVAASIRSTEFQANIPFARDTSLPNVRQRRFLSGDAYVVPEYIVGSGTLMVYVNGSLCSPGLDYNESGTAGSVATSITWERTIDISATVEAIVHATNSSLTMV